jgi:hypothetical protein
MSIMASFMHRPPTLTRDGETFDLALVASPLGGNADAARALEQAELECLRQDPTSSEGSDGPRAYAPPVVRHTSDARPARRARRLNRRSALDVRVRNGARSSPRGAVRAAQWLQKIVQELGTPSGMPAAQGDSVKPHGWSFMKRQAALCSSAGARQ